MRRVKTVGVMGSGTRATEEAAQVGQLLARLGVNLLTGGGAGQMYAVAEAFTSVGERAGQSLAVLPSLPDDPTRTKTPSYPNPFVEIPIFTHLGGTGTALTSRNHINILSSDLVICLMGSGGTISEARLARTYQRPRRLFLLPETRRQHDCQELMSCFEPDEALESLEEVEAWLNESLR